MERIAARTRIAVRSYELDGFGHLNHAVFLSYFEHARFQALEAGGFPPAAVAARGEAIHVVRVEVDYRAEALLGDELEIVTQPAGIRNSSFVLHQVAHRPDDPDHVFAEARVTVVWIGPDRRPMRVPEDIRAALGIA